MTGLRGIKIITTITTQSFSRVGAACKVSLDWSQKTMTSHFLKLFQYFWGSGLGTIGDFSSEQMLHDPKV